MDSQKSTVDLPLDIIEKSAGFTLDIGGSMGKLMYRSNDFYENGKLKVQVKGVNTGPVHLVTFRRDELHVAIEIILENCDITWKKGKDEPIKCTGVGCNYYQTKLEEQLNIKIQILSETDCNIDGLLALSKSGTDVFVQISEKIKAEAETVVKFIDAFRVDFGDKGYTKMKNRQIDFNERQILDKVEKNIHFPCIMVMCGSACSIQRVYEDGTYEFLDAAAMGGKFFMGISSIFLGQKTFNDQLAEIEAADGKTADVFILDMIPKEILEGEDKPGEETMYRNIAKLPGAENYRTFSLAQALNKPKEEIKDADIAHSIMRSISEHIAQVATMLAACYKLDHIYFAGNFANIPLVQKWITIEANRRIVTGDIPTVPNFQFLKYGGHLGTIGSFIS